MAQRGYRKIPKKYTLYKEASTSLKEAKPIAELPSGSIIRIYGRGSSLGNLKWWSVKKFIKGKPVHGYILTPEQDFNILRMMTLGLLEGYKIKGLNDADEFVTKIKTKYAKKIDPTPGK